MYLPWGREGPKTENTLSSCGMLKSYLTWRKLKEDTETYYNNCLISYTTRVLKR